MKGYMYKSGDEVYDKQNNVGITIIFNCTKNASLGWVLVD